MADPYDFIGLQERIIDYFTGITTFIFYDGDVMTNKFDTGYNEHNYAVLLPFKKREYIKKPILIWRPSEKDLNDDEHQHENTDAQYEQYMLNKLIDEI